MTGVKSAKKEMFDGGLWLRRTAKDSEAGFTLKSKKGGCGRIYGQRGGERRANALLPGSLQ